MELSQRKPNRLCEYDYSQNGAYFVTICTQSRKPILSQIVGELSQEIRDLSDGVLDIHTPYGSLQKLLLDKSVVEKGSRISSDGRVRTFYGITQKGRERMTAQESVLIRCMDSIYGFFTTS